MQDGSDTKIIRDIVKPLVEGAGYDLVELKVGRTKNLEDITLIIYKPAGVSLNDCSGISRLVRPCLDDLEEFEHIALKVSSPGIDRVFKSAEEYRIFRGRGVRVLLSETKQWTGGILEDFNGKTLRLKHRETIVDIELENIQKVKLDFTEEVGNR